MKGDNGEWTVEYVSILLGHGGGECVADAHNAALAAEKENISPEIEPGGGMSRKDKALQEQADIIAGLHKQLADEQKQRVTNLSAQSEGYRLQLAAERERHGDEMTSVQLQLNKQLDAEQEKVQALVDALTSMATDDQTLWGTIARQTLAKVKP